MIVDIDYNQQWFLQVPDPRPEADGPEVEAWARDAIDSFTVVQDWRDPESKGELVQTVMEQSTLFTTDATVGFLYCPRGLPATAVVEVALAETTGSGRMAALDAIAPDHTLLPQQITDVTSRTLGEGVLVHGIAAAGDRSLVGIASYSFVADGIHVLVTVTSPDLNAISIGRSHFDELVDAIVVTQ